MTNCSKLRLAKTAFRAAVQGSEGLSKWTLRSPTTKSLSQATYDSSKSVNCSKNIAFVSLFFLLGGGGGGGGGGSGKHQETQQCGCQGKYELHRFQSSKNKISGGNCNVFCQTVTIQFSKTTARTRHSRKRPQTKPRRGQIYTVTLVAFRPKPRFTQKNEVDVCMHHMITNISCLVSDWVLRNITLKCLDSSCVNRLVLILIKLE